MGMYMYIMLNQIGKVGDLVDYDYCKELEKKGYFVRYKKQKEEYITEAELSIHGKIVIEIYFAADSLKEAVIEENKVRLKLFNGKKTTQYREDWPKFE